VIEAVSLRPVLHRAKITYRLGACTLTLPLIHNLRELDAGPRRFLGFTACNVLSWHSIVGPSLVLFARKIDMPASWVGVLLAFMPLSMPLVIFTVGLVTRYGPKQLMASTWFLRNFVAAGVFLVPLAIATGGAPAGWIVLMSSVLGFCIVRSIGVGAWFPWIHEFLPERQRGAYFSAETAIAQAVMIAVNLAYAFVLAGDPTVNRYFIIYGIGIGTGVLSVLLLLKVPGGEKAVTDERAFEWAAYGRVLADRPYIVFLVMVSLGYASLAFLGAAAVLYMRDMVGLSSNIIMAVVTGGSVGVFLTVRYWTRYAEHGDPRVAIAMTLAGHGLVAASFIALPPWAPWTPVLLFPAIAAATLLSGAFNAISHGAMLGFVPDHDRVAYTNLWIVVTSIGLGLSPIFAGLLIHRLGLLGFEICFTISAVGGVLCGIGEWLLVARRRAIPRPLAHLFSEAQPVRTLARIAWISAGLHESSGRPRPKRSSS
jgi:MFS family permease